jgi:hypothetical protein
MSTFSKATLILPYNNMFKLALFPSNAYINCSPEKKEAVERKMVTEDVVE